VIDKSEFKYAKAKVTNKQQITVPKIVCDYFQLHKDFKYKAIFLKEHDKIIFTILKLQDIDTCNYDNIIAEATFTGVQQITIPKDVCKELDINKGEIVKFKRKDGKVIFDKDKLQETCFACNGNKNIAGNECFICEGEGELDSDVIKDIRKLILNIIFSLRKYGVEMEFLTQKISNQSYVEEIQYPVFRIRTNKYPLHEVERIQDEIQKTIIIQYTPRSFMDDSVFMIPSDSVLNAIMDLLVTDNAKEEVTKWFRYVKSTIKTNN
jgi:bifunctional DNA-binding transcriptional regulator/antitoxin component of YhaV-PrlF toxin-antitoxin module